MICASVCVCVCVCVFCGILFADLHHIDYNLPISAMLPSARVNFLSKCMHCTIKFSDIRALICYFFILKRYLVNE
jgi:hypothetical protein